MRIVTHILTGVALVAGGCSTSVPPRLTALPSTPQTVTAVPGSIGIIGISLEPESTSTAKLKDEDYHRINGDYAYVDLEAVLRIIGRIRGASREVTQIRFFERIAAAVTVGQTKYSSTVYLCSKDANGMWQVVGMNHYVY